MLLASDHSTENTKFWHCTTKDPENNEYELFCTLIRVLQQIEENAVPKGYFFPLKDPGFLSSRGTAVGITRSFL